ncbi:MAG: NAD-dependent epimerase/dehydratase family protein [Candidatus Methylacidiphilales bacterium]|nr:NAD(P)-dependent oxidoreductase [Candidatus Methylacidiphilales bacterium]
MNAETLTSPTLTSCSSPSDSTLAEESVKLKRVLLTGSGGFLGQHLTSRLRQSFALRVLDVTPDVRPSTGEKAASVEVMEGSVADSALVEQAVDGMDALVIAHMAPNRPEVYGAVDLPFSINVQGTAALLHAAAKRGVKRVVLVSSTTVVDGSRMSGAFMDKDTKPSPSSMYSLTKALQEEIARYFHHTHGMEIAVLRPAYVILEDPLKDKYGRTPKSVNWQFIDPRDIAEAAALALVKPGIEFEIFYTLAGPGSEKRADLGNLKQLLGWQPRYKFEQYPVD